MKLKRTITIFICTLFYTLLTTAQTDATFLIFNPGFDANVTAALASGEPLPVPLTLQDAEIDGNLKRAIDTWIGLPESR